MQADSLRGDLALCRCQIPSLADLYLRYFRGDDARRFVEVGAFDGFHWSNSFPLVNQGWTGLLFEPVSDFYRKCKDRYQSNSHVEMEQCAISDYCGEAKLYAGGSMTTLAGELIETWNKTDWIRMQGLSLDQFTKCEVHTLDCRLEHYNVPEEFDLLSLDAEGVEDKVLMGLNLNRHRPRMMIVELDICSQEPVIERRVDWIKNHLQQNGYTTIYGDGLNSIFWGGRPL